MDYGQDLLFGTFITPKAEQASHAVSLARLSEQAGLDLVTFQDHPYQPAFLDTWTLLSHVAAHTERVRLAPNVTNLPLRPPAVLAQAAASLDLLSGGRLDLGLGAGGFWDAIEAMGGRRLKPGESVAALEEAISIIREIWDTDVRGGVRVDGRYYRVHGAKRGPAPAHQVPIWLGAYKPRMLRLVGRAADGWLPTLGYFPGREALADLNTIIDDSAAEADREPRTIRRLLNIGPSDATPGSLVELALEYGISAFILGTDDQRTIQEFGEEIAPETRDIVEAERAGNTKHTVAGNTPVTTAPGTTGSPADLGVSPTEDSGTRLTTEMPWDENTRPTADPAPAAQPYTDRGRAVSRHLVDVHDQLRSELQQVRDLVNQVREGATDIGAARSAINEMTMRQNNWTLGAYCESYCRVVTQHHMLEDQGIFRHLRDTEDGLVPVLDRLQEEHHIIHDVLEGVDKALVDTVSHPGDYTNLTAAVDLLTDTLLSHFAYEERELLEPLARHGMYAGQL